MKQMLFVAIFSVAFLLSIPFAPTAQAAIVTDTFTEASDTPILSHTSDSGHTWTLGVGSPVTDVRVSGTSDRAQTINGSGAYYYSSAVPASADYYVEATLGKTGSSNYPMGVFGRVSTTEETAYLATVVGSYWRLYSVVNGVATVLGYYQGDRISTSTPRVVRLEMIGTSIKLYVDGVLRVSVTDSAITAAGRPGLQGGGTGGVWLDTFTADVIGSSPTPAPGDSTAPSTPTDLTATAVSSSQINLSWSASSDNIGVTGYKVYRGGNLIASPAGTSYTNTGLSPDTQYTYTVKAVDAAGNESDPASVSATTQPPAPAGDTTKPTTPSGLTATVASPTQVNLSWNAAEDNVGVTGYRLLSNGNQIATPSSLSYSNTGLSANTTYSYTVAARDAAGNWSDPSSLVSITTPQASGSCPTPTGTTFYISPSGTDCGLGTSAQPFATFSKAWSVLQPGHTLIVKNGTYNQDLTPPEGKAGTASNPITVRAENDGAAVISGSASLVTNSYLTFEGLRMKGPTSGVFVIENRSQYSNPTLATASHHITLRRMGLECALSGSVENNGACVDISAGAHDNLVEDSWIWGGGRYGFLLYGGTAGTGVAGADNNVIRRVIIRQGPNVSNSGAPQAGLTLYYANNNVVENVIVIDSLPTSQEANSAFYVTAHAAPPSGSNNKYYGVIALNNSGVGWYLDHNGISSNNVLRNSVVWNSDSGLSLNSSTECNSNIVDHVTVTSKGDGIYNSCDNTVLSSSIFFNNTRYGINNDYSTTFATQNWNLVYSNNSNNNYIRTTAGPNNKSVDPQIKYITRIEDGTACDGGGEGGTDCGANIMYRYQNGSLSTSKLWPWPNEARIKTEMCAGSYATRGFCTSGSLTEYIWEAAGNQMPSDLYASSPAQTGDTTDPTVSLTAPASGVAVSGSIPVSANASDNIGVVGVQFMHGNINIGAEDTTSPYSVNWDTTGVSNGSYTLTAIARDAAGNTTISGGRTVTVSNTVTAPPPSSAGGFTFTATGDIGANTSATKTLNEMEAVDGAFMIALGDFKYQALPTELEWCNYIKDKLKTTPIQIVVGNHENGTVNGLNDGKLSKFAECLPDQMGSTIRTESTYGREYYFDYGSYTDGGTEKPLARIIMLPAGESLKTDGGSVATYRDGTADQAWLGGVINQARATGIKWIIVGMHFLCPSVGSKSCTSYGASAGPDLFNFLMGTTTVNGKVMQRVDLVLNGHDHNYQRTKQLARRPGCSNIPVETDQKTSQNIPSVAADPDCIVDSDDALVKGAGTVIVISGVTPNYAWPYGVCTEETKNQEDCQNKTASRNDPYVDPENLYFAKAQDWSYGYTKVTVSENQLISAFVSTGFPSGGASFTDSFTITDTGYVPPPPSGDTTLPTTPAGLTATAVSSSQINLTWNVSTDNVGVTGYRIYRNGNNTPIAFPSGTSYSNTGLSADSSYSYTVAAVDAAGNESPKSASVSARTQVASAPSGKFAFNDRVQVSSGPLNVRSTASAAGTLLGAQATNNLGVVTGGPVAADGYIWWNINYDSAPDGWSVETYLEKVSSPTPSPSANCGAPTDKIRCVDDTAGPTQEYQTIQAAVNAAVAGDTVLVFDGTYRGFNIGKSGTADAPITIKANGANVLINLPEASGNKEFIRLCAASYVTIEGFTVDGTASGSCNLSQYDSQGRYGIGAHCSYPENPAKGVTIRNNTVFNSCSTNIYASNVRDSLIEGNTAYGSRSSHGMYVPNSGADNVIIRGNRLYDNERGGLHMNGDLSVTMANGGYWDGMHDNITIENNIIYGNTGDGMNLDGIQDSIIRNNLLYNNEWSGIHVFSNDSKGPSKNLEIVNNTVVQNNTGPALVLQDHNETYYLYPGQSEYGNDGGGHVIFNNIFAQMGTGSSTGLKNLNFKSNNNVFHSSPNPLSYTYRHSEDASWVSLASWRTGTGQDAQSATAAASVLFVDPANGNFRLKVGSPAINIGTGSLAGVSAPTTDITGAARPAGTAFDAGAYESGATAPAPDPTPVPPTDVTAPTISSINATGITTAAATITWNTDEAADTQVAYGTSPAYGSLTVKDSNRTTSHTALLTSLTPGTTYSYQVISADAVGNTALSGNQVFTTAPAPVTDTTAPGAIANLAAGNISRRSATLTWTAPGNNGNIGTAASYDIRYSTSPITATNFTTATQVAGEPTPLIAGTSQSYSLVNLAPGTTYYVAIKTTDGAENVSGLSNVPAFTTSGRLPKPPKVGDLTATNGSVILMWTEPRDGGMRYELTGGTLILRSTTAFITTPDASSALADVKAPIPTYRDTSAVDGTTYYYSAFSYDDRGTYGEPAFVSFTPSAPSSGSSSGGGGGGSSKPKTTELKVTKFTVDALDSQISLSWVNPKDSFFARTIVVRNDRRVPVSPTDGTTIYEGTASSFADVGLINGKRYYYAAFLVTRAGVASKPSATLTATPKAGVTQLSRRAETTTAQATTPSTGAPSIESLLTLLSQLQAQLRALQGGKSSTTPAPISTGSAAYTFTRDLSIGMEGEDVRQLQKYLNSHGFRIAETGVGAPGYETTYFGNRLEAALKRFQTAKGVSPTGYFGRVTRVLIK